MNNTLIESNENISNQHAQDLQDYVNDYHFQANLDTQATQDEGAVHQTDTLYVDKIFSQASEHGERDSEFSSDERDALPTWVPSREIARLPTKIHKDNILTRSQRSNILKNEPRNTNISYNPLAMDKRIWRLLPSHAKELDKVLAKVAYRTSAALRLLDNVLKSVYVSKPPHSDQDMLQAWSLIEGLLTNTRALLLDLLSFINQNRRDQAIKVLSPSYNPPADNEEVFSQDLSSLIEKENATNKFISEALRNKSHASNGRGNTSYNYRPTSSRNNYKFNQYGRNKRNNYWFYNRNSNNWGNGQRGGSTTFQSRLTQENQQ
ncbi:13776_t:CDS:1 [Dentiscutata heterogama]|uniref:13776_t:CDS:1 n=1 Tax=Dentiscutata heterogama TaxID=1316150 RepID=A0ACA9N3F9_9GLOM|nr:13776_t:CDS:1 [Dentiscutata heterogama]